jgi:transposase-like protein
MPAPRKHPQKDAAEVIQRLAASGHSIIGIASQLGVGKDTFKRWLEENEKLQDAFDLGKESERQALHAMIVESAKAGKGANVNAFFILKARHGYVEADRLSQKVNVEVAVNNVLVVKDHGSDEEWERSTAEQQRKLVQNATL